MTQDKTGLSTNDHFVIGDEDLLGSVRAKLESTEPDADGEKRNRVWVDTLEDIRVRLGTLLKTETVSFLLGAGASVKCGGQLIGAVPLVVERLLHKEGIKGSERPLVRQWLKIFYLAASRAGGGDVTPVTRESIVDRRNTLKTKDSNQLDVNFEQLLATLHRWRSALPRNGGRLRMDGSPPINVQSDDLDACIKHVTRALGQTCDLPTADKKDGLAAYKTLVRKVLTRPLNLKRVNIFTLNYDTLIEQAADAEGIVLLDGFVGTQRRVFRPESYEQDLYFPAATTEGRVHRFDRVLHLYKLHGSITWTSAEPSIDDPYGIRSGSFEPSGPQSLLIYPTPAKYGETLGMPYSEMFRRFAAALVRPQSVLFVIGFGFGDEHVNAIIRQALALPSFTLVIVDPCSKNEFATTLRAQKDRRIWFSEGSIFGTFNRFVEDALPDLRDEEIRQKVLATYNSLAKKTSTAGETPSGR